VVNGKAPHLNTAKKHGLPTAHMNPVIHFCEARPARRSVEIVPIVPLHAIKTTTTRTSKINAWRTLRDDRHVRLAAAAFVVSFAMSFVVAAAADTEFRRACCRVVRPSRTDAAPVSQTTPVSASSRKTPPEPSIHDRLCNHVRTTGSRFAAKKTRITGANGTYAFANSRGAICQCVALNVPMIMNNARALKHRAYPATRVWRVMGKAWSSENSAFDMSLRGLNVATRNVNWW
jgi:hypothetical protein